MAAQLGPGGRLPVELSGEERKRYDEIHTRKVLFGGG
jgi:hypothetical protein